MLGLMLNASSDPPENLAIRLYTNDLTPASSHDLADFTEASFSGYGAITLTSSDWTIDPADPTVAISNPASSFVVSGSTADEQVYGYYLTGVNTSTLYGIERFSGAPYQLSSTGDSIWVRPQFNLNIIALPVTSVEIVPSGSTTLPGTSALITINVNPTGPFRGVFLYWKPDTASSSAYTFVGTAGYNFASSTYQITWNFPSCATFPAGPPDNEGASLLATASGADEVTQSISHNNYILNGRGC